MCYEFLYQYKPTFMSNTRKMHNEVRKEKMEEQIRLSSVIVIMALLVMSAYGIFSILPIKDEISFEPNTNNEIVYGSLAQNKSLDVKEIGHSGDEIRFEIKNFDKRKKYILDLGDGKVVRVKKDVFNYKYTSNGFFTINLVESKHGKIKELFNNIITITKGS